MNKYFSCFLNNVSLFVKTRPYREKGVFK